MPDNRLDARIEDYSKGRNWGCRRRAAGIGALRLNEIGRLELLSCAVPDGQHPHDLPPFLNLIDDTIDVGSRP
jgi:hypothetical protein